MQIVIDIDEEYKTLLDNGDADGGVRKSILLAVTNGTVLPKGHGRLKDVDHYIKMQWEHPDYSLMDDAPTIIEADKVDCERINCDNCINHKYCDYE